MVERIRFDRVLELGKKLVNELGLDQSVDTLGRWMAQYIAEKIENARSETGEARDQKMSECADAILKLWAHRSELPNGKRPFEEFEQIFHVLQSLDLDDSAQRYFRQIRSGVPQEDESEPAKQWLEIASGLDNATRVLIRHCLATAAQEAVDKSRDWVALAEAIANEQDFDVRMILSIADDTEVLNTDNPDATAKAQIKDILERMQAFIAMSGKLPSHSRDMSERLPS